MDSRHPKKSFRRSGGLAFLKPYAAGCGSCDKNRDVTQSSTNGQAAIVQDSDTGFTSTVPTGLSDKLASELFARLLLELPEHRRDLQSACRDGSNEQLERSAHKLLGAVVYCELPELAGALRELKQTTGSGNAAQTRPAFIKTIRLIDDLLASSGYRTR
jgi:HPt (histidine-containing phosphotransfer) domain-containing protein